MNQEQAVGIGQMAVVWLSGEAGVLEAFFAASGASPRDLRRGAGDPDFLGFVLDHLLQTDAAVLAFAAQAGIAPGDVARARAALPGGHAPDWT